MRTLLTTDKAAELVAIPKRILRESDVAWSPLERPAPKPGKRYRTQNARRIRIRLIAEESRETFLIVGTSNSSFSFTLKWQDYDLARIDTGMRHRNPRRAGEPAEWVVGPHIHYFVAGHGLDHARATADYSFDDVTGALVFFARHCGVPSLPPVQETLRF